MKFGSHPLLDHEDVKTEENFNTRLAAIQRRRPFVYNGLNAEQRAGNN